MCLYLSIQAHIELQPSYKCPHTYTHPHPEKNNTHIFSFYLGFKQDGRRTSHSHTMNETNFPWSAVLSPPQGSGCRLVHSRMGMTQCVQDLLWMPPPTPHTPTPHLSAGISQSLSSLTSAGRKWGCAHTGRTCSGDESVRPSKHWKTMTLWRRPFTSNPSWKIRESEGGKKGKSFVKRKQIISCY